MTIARASGQTAIFVGSTTKPLTATFAASVVAGNAIMVFVKRSNSVAGTAPDDITVSDDKGNTYTRVNTVQVTDEHRTEIWRCANVATGGTVQMSMTVAGTNFAHLGMGAMEYTFSGGAVNDQNTTATGTGTSVSSGNITTTVAAELLFGGVGDTFNGSPYTPTSSFSELGDSGGSQPRMQFQDRIVSSTGTYASTETASNSVTWSANIASFSEAGGGGGGGTGWGKLLAGHRNRAVVH